MPHKPYWHRQIPMMIQWLDAISDPILDRKGVQAVFNVSQTEAHRLMKRMGGFRLAGSLIVTRFQALDYLKQLQQADSFEQEERRLQVLQESLEQERPHLAARHVVIQRSADVKEIEDMPPGISLRPGELRVEFFGTEDLLRHLFELAQIISNDYHRFQSLIEE